MYRVLLIFILVPCFSKAGEEPKGYGEFLFSSKAFWEKAIQGTEAIRNKYVALQTELNAINSGEIDQAVIKYCDPSLSDQQSQQDQRGLLARLYSDEDLNYAHLVPVSHILSAMLYAKKISEIDPEIEIPFNKTMEQLYDSEPKEGDYAVEKFTVGIDDLQNFYSPENQERMIEILDKREKITGFCGFSTSQSFGAYDFARDIPVLKKGDLSGLKAHVKGMLELTGHFIAHAEKTMPSQHFVVDLVVYELYSTAYAPYLGDYDFGDYPIFQRQEQKPYL